MTCARIIDGVVERVLVAPSIEWCASRMGGLWVETLTDDDAEQYAGPGMGFDPESRLRFAPLYDPSMNRATAGEARWINGRIYVTTKPGTDGPPKEGDGWALTERLEAGQPPLRGDAAAELPPDGR